MGKEFENGIVRRKYSGKFSCFPNVGQVPVTFQLLKIWLYKTIILSLFVFVQDSDAQFKREYKIRVPEKKIH